MKKVLYITNIEVPYRAEFFRQLAEHCDLTVLYEAGRSAKRNEDWAKGGGVSDSGYRICYLAPRKTGDRTFSLKILKYVFGDYDTVIFGCYKTPSEMLGIAAMRLVRKNYFFNSDGEPFLDGGSLKNRLKRHLVRGAARYLVAGKHAAESFTVLAPRERITPYPFSSLTEAELVENAKKARSANRTPNTVLVVGQYENYKGLDVAVKAAKLSPELRWKFVGTGKKTEAFLAEQKIDEIFRHKAENESSDRHEPDGCEANGQKSDDQGTAAPGSRNIEVIPFLQKKELEREYLNCAVMVLPSRQECWGLVINEAASYGTPVVATRGSGAAVEFLDRTEWRRFLAEPENETDLLEKIRDCLACDGKAYGEFLLERSKQYSIEGTMKAYLDAVEEG